jgi:hypothetical protein
MPADPHADAATEPSTTGWLVSTMTIEFSAWPAS